MDLWVIFLTGLTIGGLSCLVVQGGLLASIIAAREEEDLGEGHQRKHNLFPILVFLITKLIAYTILGFILGAFGSKLALSDHARVLMQFLAGIYMVAIALNLLNIHPIFRYAVIQPPRFLTRLIRNTSKSKDLFAPAFLGLMTIFIPCGTTLAMEALSISSGDPILGALVMTTFTLGTFPLFFGIGFLTTALGDAFKTRFFKLAGILVLYLGLSSINGSLILAGSPITWQTISENIPVKISLGGDEKEKITRAQVINGVQIADIKVFPNGYSPAYLQLQSGIPAKINLITTGGLGCTSQFRVPELGISKDLGQSTDIIEFTPTQKGKITFTCSMGMYSGIIEVI